MRLVLSTVQLRADACSTTDKLFGSLKAVRLRVGGIRLAGHLAPRLSPMAA